MYNPNKVSTHWLFGHSMNHRCINKQTNKQTNNNNNKQTVESALLIIASFYTLS